MKQHVFRIQNGLAGFAVCETCGHRISRGRIRENWNTLRAAIRREMAVHQYERHGGPRP